VLRQEILENIGWRFYRIWSTNWLYDNLNEKNNLIDKIEDAIRNYNKSSKVEDESIIDDAGLRSESRG
jgi:hypothetical protein